MAKIRRWKEVQWGVLYVEAENFREAGAVEFYGTRPGGDTGPFDEDVCEYIARGNRANRKVVSRVVEHEVIEYDWKQKQVGLD